MNKHTTLLITTAIVGGLTTSSCEKEQYIIPDSKKNLTPSTVIITPDTVQKPYDNHPNYENTYEELLKILDPTSKSFTKNASQTTDTTMEKKATINKSIPSKTNQSKKKYYWKNLVYFPGLMLLPAPPILFSLSCTSQNLLQPIR